MKILIVTGEFVERDEAYMDNKGWAFMNALQELGHSSEPFFYRKMGRFTVFERKKYLRYAWLAYMNKNLLEKVRQIRPDILFLSRGETVTADTLRQIRKETETIIVNVFTDNPLYIGKFENIEPCHYFFVKDTYVRDSLRKAGLKNVWYLPQCTNHMVYKPYTLDHNDKDIFGADVSLVGSRYAYRSRMLAELKEFSISIWGRGWQGHIARDAKHIVRGGDIRGSGKAKVFSGSLISLNPHHPLNDICGTNSRTFDIAACGGFQLADRKDDLGSLMKIGEEIICFSDADELKKQIVYFLDHPDERRQIAEAAHRRVLREHTYRNRVIEILDIVNKTRV